MPSITGLSPSLETAISPQSRHFRYKKRKTRNLAVFYSPEFWESVSTFRTLCHIAKRTAVIYLENGICPIGYRTTKQHHLVYKLPH